MKFNIDAVIKTNLRRFFSRTWFERAFAHETGKERDEKCGVVTLIKQNTQANVTDVDCVRVQQIIMLWKL